MLPSRLTVANFMLMLLLARPAAGVSAEPAEAVAAVRQIVAHRGSSLDRPENTLASTRRAVEAGATAVEMDVRTTNDGRLVLLHDATLERTTDGTGAVNDRTLAEVRQLDAGGWFDPKYAGERVPTLAEALVVCREAEVDALLDLKEQGEDYARAVAAEVRAHGDPRRTIVGVRSVAQARQFRELLPDARQLGLIPRPRDIEAFAEAGVESIRLWPRWLEDDTLVPRVRKAGATLHLNGTTGEPEEVLPLLMHRPESLSSDDPGRLVQTLMQLRAGTDHLERPKLPTCGQQTLRRPFAVSKMKGVPLIDLAVQPGTGLTAEINAPWVQPDVR